ncbi:uncharacterized protein METZ01_LOCUS162637 [marine metagenome]|uniref:Uncharacterized protein n=1 Tax=marine metagenome TaxID=408172 RepID=A0A382B953_9ZZZZ
MRLKRTAADLNLNMLILKEAYGGNWQGPRIAVAVYSMFEKDIL